jgi:hypothetical protein
LLVLRFLQLRFEHPSLTCASRVASRTCSATLRLSLFCVGLAARRRAELLLQRADLLRGCRTIARASTASAMAAMNRRAAGRQVSARGWSWRPRRGRRSGAGFSRCGRRGNFHTVNSNQ